MKRIMITGGDGFIGKNLLSTFPKESVLNIGEELFSSQNWVKDIQYQLEKFNPTVVFLIGACSNTLEKDVNYMMIRNYKSVQIIVDWCVKKKVPFIYSSSASNYGINGYYPSNLYGWSKYVSENYVIKSGGVALRYFNVYGPGEQYKGNMSSMMYQAYQKHIRGEQILLFPKKPKRDFIYVEDVINANLYAWKNYRAVRMQYYDVGSGEARSFEDVMDILGFPYEFYEEEKIPDGYQFFTCSDKEKWMPGWVPKYTLEDGILNYKKMLYNT
jgi:ADP-L-glycero-D-manno-heptose 6-epimerase